MFLKQVILYGLMFERKKTRIRPFRTFKQRKNKLILIN